MSTQARASPIREVCVNAWLRFKVMGKNTTYLNIERLVTPSHGKLSVLFFRICLLLTGIVAPGPPTNRARTQIGTTISIGTMIRIWPWFWFILAQVTEAMSVRINVMYQW